MYLYTNTSTDKNGVDDISKLPKIGKDKTLAEQAYLAIKNAILTNRFKPREILSEEALAEELGISRTPVRVALKELAFERLIILNKGKNAVVSDISKDDIEKVFPIRIALEPLAARYTAVNINEKQIKKLKKNLFEQEVASKTEDYNSYVQKDFEFHTLLASYADNNLLFEMIKKINTLVERFLILSETLQESFFVALEEHKKILKALEQKNACAAEELTKTHVVNVAKRILKNGD